jgi:hypothetical protein
MDRNAARREALKQLRRIEGASDANDRKRCRALIRQHFSTPVVLLDASYRTLGGEPAPSYEEANQLARSINPFGPCRAPVCWWREPKKNSGFRFVCSLSRTLHAVNLIAQDVLQSVFYPNGHIFDFKRRGKDREANAIKAALEQGYRHVFLGDLRNAFQSVQVEALYELPLPNNVIRYALDYRNMNLEHHSDRDRVNQGFAPVCASVDIQGIYNGNIPGQDGPRGLLQGSPASNLVLAWLLNDMPSVLPPDCVPFLLTDNVLVAARTEQECQQIETTLLRYFAEHRAGPFVLGSREIADIEEKSFERAGYEFELRSGAVEIAPDGANSYSLFSALYEAVQADALAGQVIPLTGIRTLSHKLSGFAAMTRRAEFFLENVEHMCGDLAEAAWRREADR